MIARIEERLGKARPEVDGEASQALSRYTFGDHDEYKIEVATTIEQRRRAWSLVYRHYIAKGYAEPNADGLWYGLHDALPETTTLLVTREGKDVATLTMVFDSPLGLPADELYAPELNRLRRQERRLFEIVSLASDETSRQRCMDVLKHMFKLAHLTARRIERATDWIITVNPRHTTFYERVFLFEPIGEKRTYQKVGGAPAVLLSLVVETAEVRYEKKYGRRFIDPLEEDRLVRFLKRHRGILERADVRAYFEEKRPLLSQTSPEAREYIRSRYGRQDTLDQRVQLGAEMARER